MNKIYFLAMFETDKEKDLAIADLNKKLNKSNIKNWWLKSFKTSKEESKQKGLPECFGMSNEEFNNKYTSSQSWEDRRDKELNKK